jgi:hypothetical protein
MTETLWKNGLLIAKGVWNIHANITAIAITFSEKNWRHYFSAARHTTLHESCVNTSESVSMITRFQVRQLRETEVLIKRNSLSRNLISELKWRHSVTILTSLKICQLFRNVCRGPLGQTLIPEGTACITFLSENKPKRHKYHSFQPSEHAVHLDLSLQFSWFSSVLPSECSGSTSEWATTTSFS